MSTRYTVSIAYDIWAKDDKSAYKKAKKLILNPERGSNPRIFELEETPFASFISRTVNFKQIELDEFTEYETKESIKF